MQKSAVLPSIHLYSTGGKRLFMHLVVKLIARQSSETDRQIFVLLSLKLWMADLCIPCRFKLI